MDQKMIDDYGKIINKTVYDYIDAHGLKTASADDMVQDCWMKLMEYNAENGKMPDFALAKKMCHGAIVDYVRYEMRRNHYSTDVDEEGDRAVWSADSYDLETDVELDALLDMFPEGSKERTYIEFYLEKAGARMTGATPPSSRNDDGYTDSNLAKMLGFKGTADRQWKTFRNRMREIIADYYGR